MFQFTQPKRAATASLCGWREWVRFQFTQPKRAATSSNKASTQISGVSIHAAQAGRDLLEFTARLSGMAFQFTQPKQAATCSLVAVKVYGHYRFNSRSPSGLRHRHRDRAPHHPRVSIHAAQAGCDVVRGDTGWREFEFQFTQPKRAATCGGKLPRLFGVFQFTQPKRAAT